MSIQEKISQKLAANMDAQYAQLNVQEREPVYDGEGNPIGSQDKVLTGTWTWDGSTTVLATDTSGVVVGDYIRLNVGPGPWCQVLSLTPDTSVVVDNTYEATIPSGATGTSRAMIEPPAPLSGTGGLDTFAKAIAEAFAEEPHELPSYLKTALPAVTPVGRMIYVSNDVGGAVLAFSDGVNWRRSTDRAIVS